MSDVRLIGINGLMGSGKDTTFECIQEVVPKARRTAFADKLKIFASLAIGFGTDNGVFWADEEHVSLMNRAKNHWDFLLIDDSLYAEGYMFPVTGRKFTGRQYLQWLGNNARKVFGDTFWIDQVLPHKRWEPNQPDSITDLLQERYPDADVVVVTDVRYTNEAERVLDLGGEVWEIRRPGTSSDGHSSEIPLDPSLVTRVIHNDGDIPALRSKVIEALGKVEAYAG